MPFVYDLTGDDGSDSDMLPPADRFVYLPAPEYTGVHAPVAFSIQPVDTAELQRLTQVPPRPRSSFLRRLLGRGASDQQRLQRYFTEDAQRRDRLWDLRQQQLLSIMVPALRAIGVRRAYCRYDGGNDEGFAWLDRYEREGGEPIGDEALSRGLHEMNIQNQLYDSSHMKRAKAASSKQEMSELATIARDSLSHQWATALLGASFGTGQYLMYGAFTVDLEKCIISDDPDAAQIVQNIGLAE